MIISRYEVLITGHFHSRKWPNASRIAFDSTRDIGSCAGKNSVSVHFLFRFVVINVVVSRKLKFQQFAGDNSLVLWPIIKHKHL